MTIFTREINWSDDIEAAPQNCNLLVIGEIGCQLMKRDDVGQWRAINGLPRRDPRLWALAPKDPRK